MLDLDVNLADLPAGAMGGGRRGGRGTGVAVFDSGLGSLSVIRRIRRAVPAAPVVYLADTANYPYGTRPPAELRRIVGGRIRLLRDRFRPAAVVVGSITPTLLLPDLIGGPVVGVRPPLRRAAEATRTGHVGVLATRSAAESGRIEGLAAGLGGPAGEVAFHPINASPLVDLVESGAFLDDDGGRCAGPLAELGRTLARDDIDSVALSSTHLPFLAERMARALPGVRLADPGEDAAEAVRAILAGGADAAEGPPPELRVFTSGDPAPLEGRLRRLGVRERVRRLDG